MSVLDFDDILSSEAKIFALSLVICCICILIPIIIFYFVQFYKLRHHVVIAKRHWKIIALQILCCILFLFIERPLAALSINHIITDNTNANPTYLIDRFLYVLCLHINLYLIVLRFWIVHYDINYNNAQTTAYWHGLIEKDNSLSTKISDHHTNFYLNHRGTLGNLTYLKRIIIAIICCTITISYGSFLFSFYTYGQPLCDIIFFIVDAFILFIPSLCIISIIWYKTPTFHDLFGIKNEMTAIFGVMVFTFIFYISWITLESMIWSQSHWIYNIHIAIECLLCFSVNILPVIWLFCCNTQILNKRKPRSRKRSTSSQKMSLSAMLSSKLGFEMFMQHLSKEFSAENGCGVVEMLQFADFYALKSEQDIEQLEKDYNKRYKPMKVKCSFIRTETDLQRIKNYIKKKVSTPNVNPAADSNENEDGDDNENDNDFDIDKLRSNTDRMKELLGVGGIGGGTVKSPQSDGNGNEDENDFDFQRLRSNTDRMKELLGVGNIGGNTLRASQSDGMNGMKTTEIRRSKCLRGQFNNYKGIILPISIPQSTIVYTKENCIKHKIVLLCDKYIVDDAKLELNISSSCKEEILRKRGNIMILKVSECKEIFTQCLTEIYDLMNGSLTRFRLTQEYQRFLEEMETPDSV